MWNYVYEAFGDIRALTTGGGKVPRNDFDFTVQQRDVHSDMLYLRARYYEPTIGRFISRDPFSGSTSNPLTLNRYVYANCNPVNLMDPRGLVPETGQACDVGELFAGGFLIVAVELTVTVPSAVAVGLTLLGPGLQPLFPGALTGFTFLELAVVLPVTAFGVCLIIDSRCVRL